MALQTPTEHPHGLAYREFDSVFTADGPVICAFHGYPTLIDRLTYRRTNHVNFHVHGYEEEGTTTTSFHMTMLNELDRYHLAGDAMYRIPRLRDRTGHVKQQIRDKLIEHRKYIEANGDDPPPIKDWKWLAPALSRRAAMAFSHGD